MSDFGFLATPSSLTFTNLEGKTVTVSSTHESFENAKQVIKQIIVENDVQLKSSLIEQLENLVAPTKKILESSNDVSIVNGLVFYRGIEIRSVLTERILWGIREGFDMKPYISFLENLMLNPSYRSVEQLYTFIETHKMGISEDGHILAYKRVDENFKDIYTHSIDNSPGQYITLERNRVSDNPHDTCSVGLHFCSLAYLPHYGAGSGNRIVIVKVNPRDVVSIPSDHNAAKARCCAYLVLSEYVGTDKEDILGKQPVFSDTFFSGDNDDKDEDSEWWSSSETELDEDESSSSESEWNDSTWNESSSESEWVSSEENEVLNNEVEEQSVTSLTSNDSNQPVYRDVVDIFNNGESPNNIQDLLKGI